MSSSIRLYTQNDCPYCDIMKRKLDDWGVAYSVINVSEDANGQSKLFLKDNGHRTVPQLYFKNIHLNKVDTELFELKHMFGEMMLAWDSADSGVEYFG